MMEQDTVFETPATTTTTTPKPRGRTKVIEQPVTANGIILVIDYNIKL